MKLYFILAVILYSGVVFSQTRIDSMLINESSDELRVYGSFELAKGSVSVAGIDLQISNWADSLITATIPESGNGSAGEVIITDSKALNKDTGIISYWQASIVDIAYAIQSNGGYTGHGYAVEAGWRYDLLSLYKKKLLPRTINILSTGASKQGYQNFIDQKNFPYPVANVPHQSQIILDMKNQYFSFPEYSDEAGYIVNIQYDSTFAIQDGFGSTRGTLPFNSTRWTAQENLFLPAIKLGVSASKLLNNYFKAYPNPASRQLNVEYSIPSSASCTIVLYDLKGNLLKEKHIGANDQQIEWDISTLTNGSYLLAFITPNGYKSQVIKILH